MQAKVSMMVPCYNKVKWIGTMLDSVIAQKWDNIELILVNDGSTDGTREVIGDYKNRLLERGYEVVIIDQKNIGLPGAIRNGLRAVTGEFVCMPDCDDILHPEYVSAMADVLTKRPNDVWVRCDFNRPIDYESWPYLKKDANCLHMEYYPYKLLESLFLSRLRWVTWVNFFRMEYLRECRVM
ncbi:MAG: glycosyltransferase family 2 protein, partial [Clostridiales bacterium]|nr:glycosyltransferase family 2 protein [Clostridiales bacterium]